MIAHPASIVKDLGCFAVDHMVRLILRARPNSVPSPSWVKWCALGRIE